jgi:hypothetical protein
MQSPQSRKEDNHDSLCEELLRERALVLSRAGYAVEVAITELAKLDQEIITKNLQLKSWQQCPENLQEQQALIENINRDIDHFNAVYETAQQKYYCLIVTREALGLRRHDFINEIYMIPAKKKKIQGT